MRATAESDIAIIISAYSKFTVFYHKSCFDDQLCDFLNKTGSSEFFR